MIFDFDPNSLADYRKFLAVRRSPIYRFVGTSAEVPDEYAASILGGQTRELDVGDYSPSPFLFDYQRDISRLAIAKKRFAGFIECGLGKTLIMMEFLRHIAGRVSDRPLLIISPLMVIPQTLAESETFYPGFGASIQKIEGRNLQEFLDSGHGIGITNYESLTQPLRRGRLSSLVVDESSMLKSHYGKWGNRIIEIGAGLEWVLALTGTPAPNDRIEYANHAVLLGACRTVNEFLARYFVNRGQTQNRWELKPYAIGPFYRDLSHWSIFVSNPATYGWKDNAATLPPIITHIHQVSLTKEQRLASQGITGSLFVSDVGGIGRRAKLGQLAKGKDSTTNKTKFISDLVGQWSAKESSLVWCLYNDEQSRLSKALGDVGNISGDTPLAKRMELIDAFKSGQLKTLITKAKLLGFGLNLQRATRQVFSGLQDSYELYWQAIKRSNRVGSTVPLNVHIPVTELEEPMVQNVLNKASRVQQDTEAQEKIFKEWSWPTIV